MADRPGTSSQRLLGLHPVDLVTGGDQTADRDDAVRPELIEKGVAPLREAGLRVMERSYDAVHKLTPEMALDAAEFAR